MQFCVFYIKKNLIRAISLYQWFAHLSFNSSLQLINGISSDLRTLLRYFNSAAIFVFSKNPFVPSASVFPNKLALYLKHMKALPSAITTLKLVVSSLE